MGNQKSSLSRAQDSKPKKPKTNHDEYRPCFQKCQSDPNYLSDLLIENPTFTKNLLKQFPHATRTFEDFIEMVVYLRKYEPVIEINEMAKGNIKQTTLIDRYFMICLGLNTVEEMQNHKLNAEEKQRLFVEYMKLFIVNPSPKEGFLQKLCSFISDDHEKPSSVHQFSNIIREYLFHAQKHLKDYYLAKFRDMQKDSHLLNHFKSTILVEDAVIFSMRVSQLATKEIQLLYSTETCGLSFHSLEKQILGYTGPWLLLIEHYDKEDKAVYKFGAYQKGPINDVNSFQGDMEGFLFSIDPKIRFMTTDKGEGGSQFFFINSIDEKVSKMRKGIGFGGNKYKENFKLWIDQDLDKSKVFNGNDPTYGFGTLASLSTQTLSIRKMEIWGLGSIYDLKNQDQYWEERNEEIMKRRKVNKKDLIDGNAGLMFEKTFAHRDQVYGEIDKKEEE